MSLSTLFTGLTDPDTGDAVVSFYVRDRTVGGGHLVRDGSIQSEDTVLGPFPISDLSHWSFVAGSTSGDADSIALQTVDTHNAISTSAVAVVTARGVIPSLGSAGFDISGFGYSSNELISLLSNVSAETNLRFTGYYLAPTANQNRLGTQWMGTREALMDQGWQLEPLYLAPALGSPLFTAAEGTLEGQEAVSYMRSEGFALGSRVFLDMEFTGPFTSTQTAYIQNWAAAVSAARYQPGIYIAHQDAATIHSLLPSILLWTKHISTINRQEESGTTFSTFVPNPGGFSDTFITQYQWSTTLTNVTSAPFVDLDAMTGRIVGGSGDNSYSFVIGYSSPPSVAAHSYIGDGYTIIDEEDQGGDDTLNIYRNGVVRDALQDLAFTLSANRADLIIAPNGNVRDKITILNMALPASQIENLIVYDQTGVEISTLDLVDKFNKLVNPGNRPPVITSGGGDATTSLSKPENSTALAATDPDADTLTYSLIGGDDQGKFQIDRSTGVLSFITAPDFEAPTDSDGNNSYVVTVQVADNGSPGLVDTQTITVNVTDLNDNPPVITTAPTQSVPENTTFVVALASTDVDTVGTNPATFSIVGGDDASKFTITGGNLDFLTAPDFENPTDSNHNSSYIVQVRASDGINPTDRTITVNVTDVSEPGSVAINDMATTEGNGGTKTLTFTVTRTGGTAAFNVDYATADGTATVANGDYLAKSGTLQFGASENKKQPRSRSTAIAKSRGTKTSSSTSPTRPVVPRSATIGAPARSRTMIPDLSPPYFGSRYFRTTPAAGLARTGIHVN